MKDQTLGFTTEDPWRIIRIMAEFVDSFQTERIPRFPVILFGPRYGDGLKGWMRSALEDSGYVSPGDLELGMVTDDIDEGAGLILEYLRRVGPPARVPKAFA